MAHDTADSGATVPHTLGELNDVDDAAFPADKSTLVYSLADTEMKKVAPSAAITVPAAITGGEAPTEAEFNALRSAFADLVTACIAKDIVAAS